MILKITFSEFREIFLQIRFSQIIVNISIDEMSTILRASFLIDLFRIVIKAS